MRDFVFEYDGNKNNSGFVVQSDTIYNVVLASDTMETIPVPDTATVVEFSATGDFFCRFDADAVVPAVDILDGNVGSELNPTKRVVKNVTSINLIASAGTTISLSFYMIPGPVAYNA